MFLIYVITKRKHLRYDENDISSLLNTSWKQNSKDVPGEKKSSQNALEYVMKGRMCLLFLIAYLIKTPSMCAIQHEAHCLKAEGEMASSVSFWKLSSCQSRSDTFTMLTSSALGFRRVPLSPSTELQNRPCDLQHACAIAENLLSL